MFSEPRKSNMFMWEHLGDVNVGRPNLGDKVDVKLYRLMQFTLRDTLIKEVGVQKAQKVFFDAGKVAGKEFCNVFLDKNKDFGDFLKECQQFFIDLKIGVMRIEETDFSNLKLIITIAEDLDCSGLPNTEEKICTFDEGFLSGVFKAYSGIDFMAKEIDCWCSGSRVCRFVVEQIQE